MHGTVIYADILFCLNLIINYFLLLASLRFSKRKINRLRIFLSSLLGALYSFIIFIPLKGILLAVSKPLLCALMVIIAVKFRNIKQLLKDSAIFFGINFLFAGLMFGLWVTTSSNLLYFYNGIVYFNISAKLLIISTIIAYIFTEIVFRITDSSVKGEVFDVTIRRNSNKISLKGFWDSGNTLCDPFNASPVMVAPIKSVADILTEKEIYAVKNCSATSLHEYGINVIPCKTAQSHTLLPVIKIDGITLKKDNISYTCENVLLGISSVFSPPDGYDLLLNSKMKLIEITTKDKSYV